MKEEKKFNQEVFFAALADRTRLRLINLIGDAEICVCFLVEVLGTNQPKISRHLAYLKKAGVVVARQQYKWVHYRLNKMEDEDAARVLADTRKWIKRDPQMQQDLKKLAKVCCAPAAKQPVSIQGAPRPSNVSASA